MGREWWEWGLLLSPFFFWGTTMVAMKGVIPKIGPFFITALRLLPAGALLTTFAAARGRRQPSGWAAWATISAFGLVDAACFQGPKIRTGFLKDGKLVKLTKGQELTDTTDYDIKGDENMIAMSYKKLPVDVKPGNVILCADGTISLTVLSCDPDAGTVKCRCENTATLGERKNCNLPGIVVDLPTLTEKDKEDILGWGVPNDIDMIALSFVRKGSDLVTVRQVLGHHAKRIKLMSKQALSVEGNGTTIWESGEWWMFLSAQSMAVGTIMVRWVSKYFDLIMATGWMETAMVGNATRFYVMAVTPMQLYSFTGIGSLETVFASYSDRAIHFMELPGEIPNSELHFFIKQRRAKHFGWLCGVGIYHGELNFGAQHRYLE